MVKHLLEAHRRGPDGYVKKDPEQSREQSSSNKLALGAETAGAGTDATEYTALEKENEKLRLEMTMHAAVQKETADKLQIAVALFAAVVEVNKQLKDEVAGLEVEYPIHSALLEENRMLKDEVGGLKRRLEIIRAAFSVGDGS